MSTKTSNASGIKKWLSRQSWLSLVVIAAVLWLLFSMLDSSFSSITNIMSLLNAVCVMTLVGMGASMIMATGELDFSIGSQVSLASMIIGTILASKNFDNYFLAVLITLGCGVLIGLFNSLLHVKFGMPAFISTLGTSTVLDGIAKTINQGQAMHNLSAWPDSFTFLGQYYVFGIIPMPIIVLIIISAIIVVFSVKTKWGRYLYAVGANPNACNYLGISADAQKVRGFIICSVLCSFAGILQGSMYNIASKAMGASMLLDALTVIMLGATIKGGVFNVPGTLLASVIIGILDSGLIFIGWYGDSANAVKGAVLLLSLISVVFTRKRTARG